MPLGATAYGVTLRLGPDPGNTVGNSNSGSALLDACVLTEAISTSFDPKSPPTFDCDKAHTQGKLASDGSWTFDLAPLVRVWQQSGYSGAAIIPVLPASSLPAPVPPPAWAIAFEKTKTAASASYTPLPPVEEAPDQVTVLAPPPAVSVAPPPEPAVTEPPAVAPAHPGPPSQPKPSVITRAAIRLDWAVASASLAAAALALLLVATTVRFARAGVNLSAVRPALLATRSRMATPLAVLGLASVLALGSVGTTVLSPSSGNLGSSGAANQGPADQGLGSGGGIDVGGVGTGGAGQITTGRAGQRLGPLAGAPTITIGVTINNSAQKVAALFGVKLPSQGNLEAQVQIMVDYVNAHGGIAGHKVVADEIQVDSTSPDPAQWDKVCTQFTEDDHVFAAIASTGNRDEPDGCYAQHRTLLFNEDFAQADAQLYGQFAPYVWVPQFPAEDQAILAEIDGLQAQGYFTKTAHIGAILLDRAAYHRIWETEVVPKLNAMGYSEPVNLEHAYVHDDIVASDVGQTAQQTQQASVKFHTDNVDHVFFMLPGGGAWLFFWTAAEQQQYHPRYGYSSLDEPYSLQEQNATQGGQNAGADQFRNSLGIGFRTVKDTGSEPFPDNDMEARCLAIYKAGGQVFGARLNAEAAETYCYDFLLLQRAAAGLPANELTVANVTSRLSRLARSFQGPLTVPGGTAFLPGRPEGTDAYRLSHFDNGCSCFLYTSPQVYTMAQ